MDIHFSNAGEMFADVFLFFYGHFLLIAGATYLLVWWQGGETFAHRRIQERPRAARPLTELLYSTWSILIFTTLMGVLWLVSEAGYTRVYFDYDAYGTAYFVFSIAVMAVVHDTYYYFAHRFMHHPRVFRHVHKLHHTFSNPTPFASYAFHPLEALLEVAWFLPLVLLVPVHPAAIAIYVVILTALNVVSHLGYEFYPAAVARWFITSTHHNMHHSGSKGHYMLYFNFWDRVLGTNAVDYEARIRAIAARPAPARGPAPLGVVEQPIAAAAG